VHRGGAPRRLDARRGASRVVVVDIQPLDSARARVCELHPELVERIDFVNTDGTLRELGDERFDVVLSKDSFEHYDDPESFISIITSFIAPGGISAVGFGPPWKAPTGGHISYMTKLPWAHLLFSERVIMAERRRFRPEENATRFEEIRGGLNKMTLKRFRRIMDASGLECRYFATNVSNNPIVRVMKIVSHVPPLREYFTANIYSIWEKPRNGSSPH
jgi:SAM-dependent methyltransferase